MYLSTNSYFFFFYINCKTRTHGLKLFGINVSRSNVNFPSVYHKKKRKLDFIVFSWIKQRLPADLSCTSNRCNTELHINIFEYLKSKKNYFNNRSVFSWELLSGLDRNQETTYSLGGKRGIYAGNEWLIIQQSLKLKASFPVFSVNKSNFNGSSSWEEKL